jgi:hydroxymethylpyrimidine pyrophosphatase-like HAD family hydrolase
MLLRVIATDYDGTIARHGTLSPAVRAAIRKARERGVLVVIVTGRIFSELRHVAGCLDFVDGVVAENGAVVVLPNGHTTLLGRAPPLALLSKLTERGIEFKVGRCVVEMDAEFASVAISLIRKLELPLAITFNRGRMMLLPASISKGAGLRELLDTLGVSVHNAVGIGDAENDHELLNCCEHGVAVSWGSQRLKDAAGYVIEGDGPDAVAEYIDRISADIRLPLETNTHRKLVLEEIEGQLPFEIPIRGRNVLIAGGTKSGKSWLAGLLAEQQILHGYTVYAFDPEGDYGSLASLPNTVVLGGGRMLPHGEDLRMLLQQGLSVVLNLSHLSHDDKSEYVQRHLPLVAEHRRARGFPHRILLDECHYFLGHSQGKHLLDSQLDGYTLVTYRPALLPASVFKLVEVVAVTKLTEPSDVDVLRQQLRGNEDMYRESRTWHEQLANLGIKEAALLPPTVEAEGKLRRFTVAPRLTSHVRHRTKYFNIAVASGREFVFTSGGRAIGKSAATLRELVTAAKSVPPAVLANHNQRHDISNWIAVMFCDHEVASIVHKLELAHHTPQTATDFVDKLAAVIESKYA